MMWFEKGWSEVGWDKMGEVRNEEFGVGGRRDDGTLNAERVPVQPVVPVRPRTGRIERRGAARGRARTTENDLEANE